MKLAFISSCYTYWGGSEVFWYKTAKEAMLNNHQVLISIYEKDRLHPNIIELVRSGASISYRRNDLQRLRSPFPLKQINHIINQRFDNSSFEDVTKFKPDNIVVSLTNTFDIVWHKKLERFLLNINIPFFLISNFNDEHNVLPFIEIEIARKIISKAKLILFASFRNWEVAERQIAMEISKEKAIVLRAPSNIDKIEYLNYPQLPKPTFCVMARYEANIKGQDVLLHVLSKDQWKKRDWVLNLYGEGNDEKYLKELSSFYGLSENVFFKGHNNDLKKIWKENNILLMPTFAEGTPIVLMIAMLFGRPAVVTNVAGNPELITEGFNGFIAESATTESFGNAMERAWENFNNWESLGLNGYNSALEKLDLYPEKTLLKLLVN